MEVARYGELKLVLRSGTNNNLIHVHIVQLLDRERNGAGVEFPQSWCASHVFLQAERVQDIQGKFAHEIVATADSRLRQHVVGTATPYILFPR